MKRATATAAHCCASRADVLLAQQLVLFVFTPFASHRSAQCGCVRRPRLVCGFVGAEDRDCALTNNAGTTLSTQHPWAANYSPCKLMLPSATRFGAACCSGMDFWGSSCCRVFGVIVVLWDTPKPVRFAWLLSGEPLRRLIPEAAPWAGCFQLPTYTCLLKRPPRGGGGRHCGPIATQISMGPAFHTPARVQWCAGPF